MSIEKSRVVTQSIFAQWLREFMSTHSLNAKAIAKCARVSTKTVYEWLRGKGPLHPTHVQESLKLAVALNRIIDADEPLALLREHEPPAAYGPIPEDMRRDGRLLKAISELVDILRFGEQKEVEWILGNIEVFARDAKRDTGAGRRRAG